MAAVNLFVYGTLRPDYIMEPPVPLFGHVPDSVHGKLEFDQHGNVYLTKSDDANQLVNGFTCLVAENDLVELDMYEGSGYRRCHIVTELGFESYVYMGNESDEC